MKTILLVWLILFPCSLSYAYAQEQDEALPVQSVILQSGLNTFREDLLIPKVHRGSISSLGYAFEKERKIYFYLAASLGLGPVKTVLETESQTWNAHIRLSFMPGYQFFQSGRVSLRAGMKLNYTLEMMEYPVWDESRAYWSTSLSAGPWCSLELDLNNTVSWLNTVSFCSPGVLSRPDEYRLYAQEEWTLGHVLEITHSNFIAGSLQPIRVGEFKTELRMPFTERKQVSISYLLHYARTARSDEPTLTLWQNSLGIGIIW